MTEPTNKRKKIIDHISTNLNKIKILHSNIVPCPTISTRDTLDITYQQMIMKNAINSSEVLKHLISNRTSMTFKHYN